MKELIVYTDGSCINNGRKNAHGGIGIYFPNKELKDLSKPYKLGNCTNQKTELYAILTALRYIKQKLNIKKYKIIIKTDSAYSINCVTKWIYKWQKNNWLTSANTIVANRDLIELINKYYEKYDITFIHVDAHTHKDDFDSISNDHADKLAVSASRKSINSNDVSSPIADKLAVSTSRKFINNNNDVSSLIVELVKN